MRPAQGIRRTSALGALAAALAVPLATPASAEELGATSTMVNPQEAISGWAAEQFMSGAAGWIYAGIEAVVGGALEAIHSSTSVDPSVVWFSGPGSPFAAVRGIAVSVVLMMALGSIVLGVIQGDAAGMARRALLGVPAAAIATAAITVVTAHALAITDALASAVLAPTATSAGQTLAGLFTVSSISTGGAAGVLLGGIAIIAGVVIWAELLVRSVLVLLLVAVAPLSFAAAVFPPARDAARRMYELLVAVVLSKLVIAIALAVGIAALAHSPTTGVAPLVVGMGVLVLAAFSPFVVLRLFPMVESAAVASGVSSMPVRAAQTTIGTGATATSLGRGAMPPTPAPIVASLSGSKP